MLTPTVITRECLAPFRANLADTRSIRQSLSRNPKGGFMRNLAIVAILLGMPVLSHAQTNRNSWDALNTLHVGQRIEVVETNLKKHKGTFSTVTDEVIQLREGGSDVGIKREDV